MKMTVCDICGSQNDIRVIELNLDYCPWGVPSPIIHLELCSMCYLQILEGAIQECIKSYILDKNRFQLKLLLEVQTKTRYKEGGKNEPNTALS